MMAKANVEPLNCQSWWQAIQCCTCLVHNAAWKPGGLFWRPGPAGSKAGSVAGSQLTPEPSPMDGMRWGWPETSRAWNWTGDEQRSEEERDQNVSVMMSLLCQCPSFTSNTSSSMSTSTHQFWQQVNTSPSLSPQIHSKYFPADTFTSQSEILYFSQVSIDAFRAAVWRPNLKLRAGGHFEQQVENPTIRIY